jgi:hypothetical protein
MSKLKLFVVPILILAAVGPSFAEDPAKLLGTWKLVSYEAEYQTDGTREPVLGKNWVGYVLFTPEGRVISVLTAEGRKPPSTDQDRSDLYKSMIAYTGFYRLEGDALTLKADVSWNPAWLSGDQARTVKFEGDRLQVLTGWTQAIAKPEKGMARGILALEKVK